MIFISFLAALLFLSLGFAQRWRFMVPDIGMDRLLRQRGFLRALYTKKSFRLLCSSHPHVKNTFQNLAYISKNPPRYHTQSGRLLLPLNNCNLFFLAQKLASDQNFPRSTSVP